MHTPAAEKCAGLHCQTRAWLYGVMHSVSAPRSTAWLGSGSVQACSTHGAPLCGRRHDKEQRHKVAMPGSCAGRKAGAKTLNVDGGSRWLCRQRCPACGNAARFACGASDAVAAMQSKRRINFRRTEDLAPLRRWHVSPGRDRRPRQLIPVPSHLQWISRAYNQARPAGGACWAHAPSGIALRRPVRRACRRDTAASRPGPESPGRPTG